MASKGTRIERVTMIVEMDSGEKYTLVEGKPGKQGNNPAFILGQFDAAVDSFNLRYGRLITGQHGTQIGVVE